MMIVRELIDCAREIGADTAARKLSGDDAKRELVEFLSDQGLDVNNPSWATAPIVAEALAAFVDGRGS